MLRALFGAALVLCTAAPTFAQYELRALVRDAETGEPLPGASITIPGTRLGATTGADGRARVAGIPPGDQTVVASFVGYAPARRVLAFPLADSLITFALEPSEEEEEEFVVSATRASRTIDATPTRVETIAGEEIDEKVTMAPSNLTMLLAESPGIVVQPTSAVTASAGFRIQGLDGRYTQLLRDGFPLYGGFAGSLSVLQVPPLDLARVEIIKGPASTLYGGDAIAGLINLVTKTPGDRPERSLLLNATTAGGVDAGLYASGRNARVGYTALVSANGQRAYNADGDGFTNLPRTSRLTVAPTFFRYGAAGVLRIGASATLETRTGGYRPALTDGETGYAERNASRRFTAHAGYERVVGSGVRYGARASASRFHRGLRVTGTAADDTRFSGDQTAAFAEATAGLSRGAHGLVVGLDARADRFDEHAARGAAPRDYVQRALGAFAQHTADVSRAFVLETGLRVDATDGYGAFVLPRASLLARLGGGWTARVGGGLGYKQPTFFLEAAELRAFRGVAPLAPGLDAETAAGGTFDVNYRGLALGRLPLSFNANVFHTRLERPLALAETAGTVTLQNLDGRARTQGVETSARLDVRSVKLFLGYVYLDAAEQSGGATRAFPLTAAHRTYTVAVWEREGRARVGVEAYYTGPQRRADGTRTPGYVLAGVMGERRFGHVRAFVNFENVLDARQSRTAPLVSGPPGAPRFAELWGATDGFVANAGVKIDF